MTSLPTPQPLPAARHAAGRPHRGAHRPGQPARACCPTAPTRRAVRAGSAAARAWSAGAARWSSPPTAPTGSSAPRRGGATSSTRAVVRDEVGLPGTGPVAFGSVAYAAGVTLRGDARRARGGRRAPRRRLVGHHHRHRAPSSPSPVRAPAVRAAPSRRASRSPTARCPPPQWAGAVERGGASGSPPATSTRWCWPATCEARAAAPIDPRWLLHAAGRALRHDLGLRRRRPGRRDPGDAGAAREGPGHLARAGRHHPAHR